MLESAGFEMAQMVWYCGSDISIKEQGNRGTLPCTLLKGATNSIGVGDGWLQDHPWASLKKP